MKGGLRKSIIVYTFSSLLSSALPFLLLPFLTHVLTKADYGILSNFTGLLALVRPMVGINFEAAYSRQYYKKEIDIPTYLSTGFTIQFILAIIISLLLLLFEDFVQAKTGIDAIYIRLVALYCFFFGIVEVILTRWRLMEKVWYFALFRILRTLVEVALTVLFILVYGMHYDGRIIAIIATAVLALIPVLGVISSSGLVSFRFNKEYARHMLRYGIPLIPHALGATVLAYSDKIIITNEISLEANGVYSVAFQVGMIIGLVQNSFNQAWVPWFYKSLSEVTEPIKKKIVRITYLYYIGLTVITVGLVFGTPIIYMVLGKEFEAGSSLVSWVALGFLFNGMYKMVVNYLFYTEKTFTIGMITVFAAVINITLNFILIDYYGLTGAAMATCITFFLQFVSVWLFAQASFKMPWFRF